MTRPFFRSRFISHTSLFSTKTFEKVWVTHTHTHTLSRWECGKGLWNRRQALALRLRRIPVNTRNGRESREPLAAVRECDAELPSPPSRSSLWRARCCKARQGTARPARGGLDAGLIVAAASQQGGGLAALHG